MLRVGIDPCGTVMDFSRAARPSFMQQFNVPGHEQQPILWYEAHPTAKVFPGWSSFANYNWDEFGSTKEEHSCLLCDRSQWPYWGFDEDGTPESGIGECRQEGAPWANGFNWKRLKGQHFCGAEELYERGVDPDIDETWLTDIYGGGECCPAPPMWVSGFSLTSEIGHVAIEPMNVVQHVAPTLASGRFVGDEELPQPLPAGVPTVIQWPQPDAAERQGYTWDAGGGNSFQTFWRAGDPYSIYAPWDGEYEVTATVEIETPLGFPCDAYMVIGGTLGNLVSAVTHYPGGGFPRFTLTATARCRLAASSSLNVVVGHNAPSTLNVVADVETSLSLSMIAPTTLAGPTGICASIARPNVIGPIDLCQPHEENYGACWTPTCLSPDWSTGSTLRSHIVEPGNHDWLTGSSVASAIGRAAFPALATGSTLTQPLLLWERAQLTSGNTVDSVVTYTGPPFSVDFDGASTYGSSPAGAAPATGSDWSLSCWCKGGTAGPVGILDLAWDSVFNHGGGLELQASGAATALAGTGSQDTAVPVDDGTWHHILATWEDGTATLTMYLDGALSVGPSAGPGAYISSGIGAYLGTQFLQSRFFNGKLTQPAIWGAALSGTDAANLALGASPLTVPGLVAFWPMSEGAGTALADASGNGFTITLHGVVTWDADIPPVL